MKVGYIFYSHQLISNTRLDKLTIFDVFGLNATQSWKPLPLPFSSYFFVLFSGITFCQRLDLDELKQLSCIILYCLQENIKYDLPRVINIIAIYPGGVHVNLPYRMMFIRISKHLNASPSPIFIEIEFLRRTYFWKDGWWVDASSPRCSQSDPRDEVKE